MPEPKKAARRRTLVTLTEKEIDRLTSEARKSGLRLATYLRHLIFTNTPRKARASGAGTR